MFAKRHNHQRSNATEIAEQAALWLARRDRGLTPAEQDEYLQWLTAKARHAEVLAQHAAAFERMMKLYEWQPGQSADANPDLFAPPRARRRGLWGMSLAAAAAIMISGALWWGAVPMHTPAVVQRTFLRINESQVLPDGSRVELKDGSRIAAEFSSGERRVRLTGEAHFNVAKSAVPFVVQVDGLTVRAVGTAFNVRAEAELVEVLVTEGKVAVQQGTEDGYRAAAQTPEGTDPGAGRDVGGSSRDELAPSGGVRPQDSGTLIGAGQRVVVVVGIVAPLQVDDATPEELAATLAWKIPRLQFFETPLAVAVEEFNRRNRIRLVLGDRVLDGVPIGGTFRIDNVDGFVRLLVLTLDVRAERRNAEEIVITRQR